MVPIVRCLFYWISRGHKTTLCILKDDANEAYGTCRISNSSAEIYQRLIHAGLVEFIDGNEREWYYLSMIHTKLHSCFLIKTRKDG